MRASSVPTARHRCIAAFVVSLAIGASAAAQTGLPGLLRDVASDPQPVPDTLLNNPVVFVPLSGEVYFAAWDPTEGLELRATDGTAAGTRTVRDVCPGSCNGFLYNELVESGGILYFGADDGAHGRELWRSDGTAAGTGMVADVAPGLAWSQPFFLTPVPGGVAFVANDGARGYELWWSDGTSAGTHLVADLLPGNPAGDHYGPSHLIWLSGEGLVFAAEDATHGREIWLSADGTAGAAAMLADVKPGAGDGLQVYEPYPGSPGSPRVAGGKVFFAADDGVHGTELWATDGSVAGTELVLDIAPGADSSQGYPLHEWQGILYFPAGATGGWPRTLWRSDGTAAGTYPLGDAGHGTERLNPHDFAALGDRLYFPGYQEATGSELWSTDGTVDGTQRITDLTPGSDSGVQAYFAFTAAGGRLWFPATDGTSGTEWWQSDGTSGGTFQVEDLMPGSGSSTDWFLTFIKPEGLGSTVLLGAQDPLRGWTVRAAQAGATGTTIVHTAAARPGALATCTLRTCPPQITPVTGGVAFPAREAAHGSELWRSDGSSLGTMLAVDLAPGPSSSMAPAASFLTIAPLGSDVLFSASDAGLDAPGSPPQQLWRVSATGASTQLTDGDFDHGPGDLVTWNGAAYFAGSDGIWRSDGTPAGTGPLAGPEYAHGFAPGASQLFFVANGLWKTDGSAGGTEPVAPALGLSPGRLVLTADSGGEDRLYFPAADAIAGNELWVSDGSDGGTQRVVDLLPGAASGMSTFVLPGGLEEERLVATLGPLGVFAGSDGIHGDELWVTDGTPGNATLLEVRPGAAGSEPRDLTAAGGRIYFVADDGVHGREPWVSDGTTGGTHLVADVRPGPESSSPQELVDWMGRLVFAADDDVHGMELWRVDAAGAGAQLVVDLRPGVEPASPQGLTAVGERLYFFADDGTTGLEPWVWSAASDLFRDSFETGAVDRWSSATEP